MIQYDYNIKVIKNARMTETSRKDDDDDDDNNNVNYFNLNNILYDKISYMRQCNIM